MGWCSAGCPSSHKLRLSRNVSKEAPKQLSASPQLADEVQSDLGWQAPFFP